MNGEAEYLFVCLLKALFLLTLQYLAFCDQIIFLEDGKICEKGIHSELIQKKGRYAELVQKMHGGGTTQVISTPPHPRSPQRGAPPHLWCVLSPQDKPQDTAKPAEDRQGQGQAQATCQEEPVHDNAGNGAGNRERTFASLPGSSRGPGISSWTPDGAMSLTVQDPRHPIHSLQIHVVEGCGVPTVLVRRSEDPRGESCGRQS